MTTWAVSMCVYRDVGRDTHIEHTACVIPAVSGDEAIGKGLRMARKIYPHADGWRGHHVRVHDCSEVVNPDKPFTITDASGKREIQ